VSFHPARLATEKAVTYPALPCVIFLIGAFRGCAGKILMGVQMSEITVNLPPPMTQVDCDLRDFAFMPLDVGRLRDSDLAANQPPDACWAALLLWCAAWHQVPAASIPEDENWIAKQAGYMSRGKIDKAWKGVRDGALHGFIKCSDGRLYHQVVAEKAKEAWTSKLRQRWKTECARIKKHNERHATNIHQPDFDEWLSLGCPKGQYQSVASDNASCHNGQSPPVTSDKTNCHEIVTSETASKGQGQGQGYINKPPKPPTPVGVVGKSAKPSAIGLPAWLAMVKADGKKPIPPDDPVFAYADDAGLPVEFVRLAWVEFRARYSEPGAKRYIDWRRVFRKAVRGNWFRLWYATNDGAYALTTQGAQAQRVDEKVAA